MAHQFFDTSLDNAEIGQTVTLTGPEAHHAQAVTRLRLGENVRIGNGRGLILSTEVVDVQKSQLTARVEHVLYEELLDPKIILVQALAKTDRDLRAIESSTELGVDVVIPWAAQRSISKWEGEKIHKGHTKWTTTVTEAAKQSLRSWIPEVYPYCTTSEVLERLTDAQIVVLHPDAKQGLSHQSLGTQPVALIVGPEGGISEEELSLFSSAGAKMCSLGPHVLRTSTAGTAAIAIINAKLGRC